MYEQHELSPFLQGLDTVTRSVVHQCAALIQEALEHLQSRYSNTLCIEGSHKRIKDIYRRIEWFAREKERIRNLQEKLTESIQRLSLLINLASESVWMSPVTRYKLTLPLGDPPELTTPQCSLELTRYNKSYQRQQTKEKNY